MMQFLMRSEQPVKCSIFRSLPSSPVADLQTVQIWWHAAQLPCFIIILAGKYMITSCFITHGSSCAALTSSSRIINTPSPPPHRILIKTHRNFSFQLSRRMDGFSKTWILERKKERKIENLCEGNVSYLATWNEKKRNRSVDGGEADTVTEARHSGSSLSCGHCGHCSTFDCQYVVPHCPRATRQISISGCSLSALRASDF